MQESTCIPACVCLVQGCMCRRAQRGSELLEAAAVPRAAQVGTEQVH